MDPEKETGLKSKSQESTLRIPIKDQAISYAKKFILENSQEFPAKELLFITKERLRAYYHLGELRLEHYLQIALSELKVKHNLDLEKNLQEDKDPRKYTINQIRKKYPMAYEPWTKSDDETLKKSWVEKSSQKTIDEVIQDLMKKFGRNRGAIVSRLKKIGLE